MINGFGNYMYGQGKIGQIIGFNASGKAIGMQDMTTGIVVDIGTTGGTVSIRIDKILGD